MSFRRHPDAYTDDIMQPAYRKGASAYTSSDREVYNALKTTGLTVTKKWAEDEDNTYKTRPQTKQSGADWETSFLIQRKSGADGWETVKTYSGSADHNTVWKERRGTSDRIRFRPALRRIPRSGTAAGI